MENSPESQPVSRRMLSFGSNRRRFCVTCHFLQCALLRPFVYSGCFFCLSNGPFDKLEAIGLGTDSMCCPYGLYAGRAKRTVVSLAQVLNSKGGIYLRYQMMCQVGHCRLCCERVPHNLPDTSWSPKHLNRFTPFVSLSQSLRT